MKITFPHMGNTYILAKGMLDDLGLEYVIPPFNNKQSLEIGTRLAPELACLPLKINIGNFIQAYEQGADTILITGGCGPCRFGYYCEMHREILHDLGIHMDIVVLEYVKGNPGRFLETLRKLAGGLNPFRIAAIIRDTARVSKQVDELERFCFKMRAREQQRGTADRVYRNFLKKVLEVKGCREILELVHETRLELEKIPIDKEHQPLRIGIVGEIYTTIDPFANFDIAAQLGKQGIEVDRSVTVSQWVIEHIIKNALHLPRDLRFREAAAPYLGTMIGGHAQETVGNTVLYARDGYDGVIQIYPLTCMPEIVAESILPAVERDLDIPVLTLIMDEMTGEAGYYTRIEAFVELLEKRRERSRIEGNLLLSGN